MWNYPISTKTTVFLANLSAVRSQRGNTTMFASLIIKKKKVYMLLNQAVLARSTRTQIFWWKHSVNVSVFRQTGLPSLSGRSDDTTQAGWRHFVFAFCCFGTQEFNLFRLVLGITQRNSTIIMWIRKFGGKYEVISILRKAALQKSKTVGLGLTQSFTLKLLSHLIFQVDVNGQTNP